MGSLVSKPKVRSVPTIVYRSPPATRPAAANNTGSAANTVATGAAGTNAQATQETGEDTASKARKNNLLSRNRGRLSTVLTGFRGVLTPQAGASERKTLLGE